MHGALDNIGALDNMQPACSIPHLTRRGEMTELLLTKATQNKFDFSSFLQTFPLRPNVDARRVGLLPNKLITSLTPFGAHTNKS